MFGIFKTRYQNWPISTKGGLYLLSILGVLAFTKYVYRPYIEPGRRESKRLLAEIVAKERAKSSFPYRVK